jgi:hypothetical protein
MKLLLAFLAAVEEEQFLRQYFYQVPLSTIQTDFISNLASQCL